MDAVKQIDELIKAGWHVLDTDFDENAFQEWREKVYDYLVETMGPDHQYTQHFRKYVRERKQVDLLAGTGVLIATKEHAAVHRPNTDGINDAKRLFRA